MRTAIHHLSISAALADALFASALQRSEEPTTEQVRQVVVATLRTLGSRGCAELVAQEFGDHPEAAVARMRWACTMTGDAFAPGHPPPGSPVLAVRPLVQAGHAA